MKKMAKQSIERVQTGIGGFDGLIEGGIPKGYAVLLSGSPGTGKTIFGLQFLINGVKEKEHGLFVTFEESPSNLVTQTKQFGNDLEKLRSENKIVIRSMPEEERLNENLLFGIIESAISDHKVQRLVIDSLDSYANNITSFEDEDKPLSDQAWQKRVIYRLLKRLQRYPSLTKVLVAETREGVNELSKDGVSEFLCDGAIRIEYATLGGDYSRQIRVRKMRSTKNDPDIYPMEISSAGIIVHTER